MIISAKNRFIFAAVPKTGTHAVRQALREHLGPDDLEQVGLFVTKRFPMPELAKIGGLFVWGLFFAAQLAGGM